MGAGYNRTDASLGSSAKVRVGLDVLRFLIPTARYRGRSGQGRDADVVAFEKIRSGSVT